MCELNLVEGAGESRRARALSVSLAADASSHCSHDSHADPSAVVPSTATTATDSCAIEHRFDTENY